MTKFEEYYRFISDNLPKEDRDLFNSIGSANRHAARMQLLGWSDNFDNVKAIAHAIGNVETQNMIIIDLLSRIYQMQYEEYAIKHEIREKKIAEFRAKKENEKQEEQMALAKAKKEEQEEREKKLFQETYGNVGVSELKTAKDILTWVKANNAAPYNKPETISALENIAKREMLYGNNRDAAMRILQESLNANHD